MVSPSITNVDADWDDESGQVELRIEAQRSVYGTGQSANILAFLFTYPFLQRSLLVRFQLMHVYEVRPRKDKRGVALISDALPFGRLWYGEPNVS